MRLKSTDSDSPTLFPLETSRKSIRKLWPTPNLCGNYNRRGASKTSGDGLATVVGVGSSLEVSPAKTSPLLVRERESGEVGQVFGLRCGELLGTYDPDTSLLKTLEQSLFEGLTLFLVRLPKSGMMRNGKIYEQAMWVRRTKGNASGSWLTPSVEDAGRQGSAEAWKEYSEKGRTTQARLRNQVKMWPTPRASLRGDCPSERKRHSPDLHAMVKMWPTPRVDDSKNNNGPSQVNRHAQKVAVGGALNPTWVEWLMGYPLGWTDLNASGIPLSLKSQKSSLDK